MLDHRERDIYKEIEKHGKIRYNELKRIVDKKQIASERIFREKLAQMVKDKLILRTQIEKQNVVYSITMDAVSKELEINNGTRLNLEALEGYFKSIENKIIILSTYDRAELLYLFYQVFMYQELFYRIASVSGVIVSKDLIQKTEELKSQSIKILSSLESEEKQKTLKLVKSMMLKNSSIVSGQLFTILKKLLK